MSVLTELKDLGVLSLSEETTGLVTTVDESSFLVADSFEVQAVNASDKIAIPAVSFICETRCSHLHSSRGTQQALVGAEQQEVGRSHATPITKSLGHDSRKAYLTRGWVRKLDRFCSNLAAEPSS